MSGASQDSYIDGMPLGSRGGLSFRHNFPADGEYHLSILDLDVGLYPSAAESRQTVVMFVDGKEVFRGDVGGPEDLALVDREGADGRAKIIKRVQQHSRQGQGRHARGGGHLHRARPRAVR